MLQYYKNFILCGDIDYFCILCNESFVETKDVDKHIRWEKHRYNIKTQEQLPKYRKEGIFKVQEYFYCQFCNFITKDPTEHISNEKHSNGKENKNISRKKQTFVEIENNKIKINGISITELQWHGIFEMSATCVVCNETVDRTNTHMKSFTHIANLIQSTIKFENNKCYRELQGDNFLCFNCFKTYNNKLIKNHLSSKCDDKSDDSKNVTNKTTLNLECKETINIKHRAVQSEEENKVWLGWYYDHGKCRSELAKYGRENYIHLNEGGCKGYCTLCDVTLSAHIDTLKQHVNGAQHSGLLEIKGIIKERKHIKPPYKKIPHKKFITDTYGPFKIDKNVVICINDGTCIDLLSFMFIKVIKDFRGTKKKCLACDVNFNCDNSLHFKTKEHSNITTACKVLLIKRDDYDEFIREIHPGLYHCGFCNKVFAYWEAMQKHLKSFPHKIQKGKKKVLSNICVKMLLNPTCPLELIEEYHLLKSLNRF